MNKITFKKALLPLAISLTLGSGAVNAGVLVQCPGDKDGDAAWNSGGESPPNDNVKCMHLTAGDGYGTMGDGKDTYLFSYADITGVPTKTKQQKEAAIQAGILAHQWPAPTIVLDEGDEFYLSLTNVGMLLRPDLFDTHTVHFHGFPQAATVYDGVPDSSISISMGATLTYYYKINDPGTYMYHCHVEATEHMQMGMLGNLYVKPAQNGTVYNYGGKAYSQFAYNDGDGSTGYDVEYPLQLGSFDGAFHDASESTQPLPFALMEDNYPMINGRGYPDTVNPDPLPLPAALNGFRDDLPTTQPVSSLITADAGDRVLLRISNLSIYRYYTLQSLGLPMHVVGKDAKLLRTTGGTDLYYDTNSVQVGGGESFDVILDVPAGASGKTFYLYSSNLNYLSNDDEAFGGMMTEIRIN